MIEDSSLVILLRKIKISAFMRRQLMMKMTKTIEL
jgi:hypothetical protein